VSPQGTRHRLVGFDADFARFPLTRRLHLSAEAVA
jgi:hypothetical protein